MSRPLLFFYPQSTDGLNKLHLSWFTPLKEVPGLKPHQIEFLAQKGLTQLGDLFLRTPLRLISRQLSPPFSSLVNPPAGEITAIGRVVSFGEKRGRRPRFICIITDGSGFLQGVWFNNYHYYREYFKPDQLVAFTGRVTLFDGPQIVHPQVTTLNGRSGEIALPTGIIPVYPSGEEWEKVGLGRKTWAQLIKRWLKHWQGDGPFFPTHIAEQEGLGSLKEVMEAIHQPQSLEAFEQALKAMKFWELYRHQLLMVILRRRRLQGEGIIVNPQGSLFSRFLKQLPFTLSSSQIAALETIREDLRSGRPMHRLLQGEVGSGKTVVALAAATLVIEAGYQVAMMAPTEILARQHYQTARRWLEGLDVKVSLITAGCSTDYVKYELIKTERGHSDLIIGTHTLIQERVQFPQLGLVIIDEQQRFGVRQRGQLVGKGIRPHLLLMTATPIPRTLALVHYGDLDITQLELIPGQSRRVKTRVVNQLSRDKVFSWLREKLESGQKAYLIFPVIDEGPSGLEAAKARFKPYQEVEFRGIPMALVHGRMPAEDRFRALDAFYRGEVRLLVATAVVEVGVDVPQANIMVVENAERFGLTQLHQLRGRIGRRGQKGYCILITAAFEGEPAWDRLKVMEQTDDGLALAEEDLKRRGAGEPLGERQWGIPKFQFSDLSTDYELLIRAHRAAERTLNQMPDLKPFPYLRSEIVKEYRRRVKLFLAG